MISYDNIKKELENINIDLITKYLINNGWKLEKDFPNKKMMHFIKNYDDEEFCVNIPASEKFKDFKIRVKDAISNISILEDVDFNEILMSISSKNNLADIFSIRIISNISENGKIPLEYSEHVVGGISKLFKSAIANEKNPKPYFSNGYKSCNTEFSNYYLSQTKVGSYIFNVEINNTINEQVNFEDHINNSETSQRKVIKRIQNGLNIISNIDNIDNLDIKSMYKEGFNVNMCDAILNLKYGDYKIDLETSIKWAEGIEEPKDIPNKIVIGVKELNYIEQISQRYKSEKKIEINCIKGYIIKLESPKDKNGKILNRNIVIQTMLQKKLRQVKVYLSEDDYNLALDAHKSDLIVSIYGNILKRGNLLEIENYNKFEIYE